MNLFAVDERYYAAVFALCLLLLVVVGIVAVLRQHPKLGRARVVIPLCAGAAAFLSAFDEIAFRSGFGGAPRAAAFGAIAGVAWGIVFTCVIGGVRHMVSWRSRRAAQR